MDTDKINKTKVAIVTGSSSGIGFETSLLLARNGFFTYATMRNLGKSNRIIELKQKERSKNNLKLMCLVLLELPNHCYQL
jgi:NAD(P)-dependent dehydrogenase (short-subunit alcohol dehydrogenase family)